MDSTLAHLISKLTESSLSDEVLDQISSLLRRSNDQKSLIIHHTIVPITSSSSSMDMAILYQIVFIGRLILICSK